MLAAVLMTGAVLASAAGAADGDLDPTFGTNGRSITDLGAVELADDMKLQPDGRIVLAGTRLATDGRAAGAFAIARYLPDGSLDATFSGDGVAIMALADSSSASGLAIQADGRIVLTGGSVSFSPFAEAALVLRVNADASPDETFSGDGRLISRFPVNDVAVQADGRIVTAGSLDGDFALARYNPDGSPDLGFGTAGLQTIDIGTSADQALSIAIESGGAIVAAGSSSAGGRNSSDGAVARLKPDGSPDAGFSGDGARAIGDPGVNEAFLDVVVQDDGRILAGGQWGLDFLLARVHADGSLDNSLAGDGIEVTDVSAASDAIRSLALGADGKIVAAGGDGDFTVARYNRDGSLDRSFSEDGVQKTAITDGSDVAAGVALTSDGCKIVAGGEAEANFAVARYRNGCSGDLSPSGSGPAARAQPIARLFGSRLLRLGRFVSFVASCREAPCRVTASASVRVARRSPAAPLTLRLKSVSRTIVRKGTRARIALRLSLAARRRIRRALHGGLRVTVRLRVGFVQPGAKPTTLTRNVRLRL